MWKENEQHSKVTSSEVREPTVSLLGGRGNQACPWQEQHDFDSWRETQRTPGKGLWGPSREEGCQWALRLAGMAQQGCGDRLSSTEDWSQPEVTEEPGSMNWARHCLWGSSIKQWLEVWGRATWPQCAVRPGAVRRGTCHLPGELSMEVSPGKWGSKEVTWVSGHLPLNPPVTQQLTHLQGRCSKVTLSLITSVVPITCRTHSMDKGAGPWEAQPTHVHLAWSCFLSLPATLPVTTMKRFIPNRHTAPGKHVPDIPLASPPLEPSSLHLGCHLQEVLLDWAPTILLLCVHTTH